MHTELLAGLRGRHLGIVVALALAAGLAAAAPADAATMSGKVISSERTISGSHVQLRAARRSSNVVLGSARTNRKGRFSIRYSAGRGNPVIYAVATGGRAHLRPLAAPAGRRRTGHRRRLEADRERALHRRRRLLARPLPHQQAPARLLAGAAERGRHRAELRQGRQRRARECDLQLPERLRHRQPRHLRQPRLDPRRLHLLARRTAGRCCGRRPRAAAIGPATRSRRSRASRSTPPRT